MSRINAQPVEIVKVNSENSRIDILVCDENGDPIDATALSLIVSDLGDNIIHKDAYPLFTLAGTVTVGAGQTTVNGTGTKFRSELTSGDTIDIAAEIRVVDNVFSNTQFTLTAAHTAGAAAVSMTKTTRIVKPAATTGQYYFPFGDGVAPANTPNQAETKMPGDYLFCWDVTGALGTEGVNVVQVVKVVTGRTLRLLPYFRLLLDKTSKSVNDDPTDPCFLGYTDSQLLMYLEGGLQTINAYQPYPSFRSLDEFPDLYRQVLLEAGLIAGVISQQLFAIDTDIPNYCFVEGTQVALADGSRQPVESIVPGDHVLDRLGHPQTVQAMWCEGTPDDVIEIVTWGGRTMRSTVNHEWPVWAWPRACACGCDGPVRPGKMFAHGHHARVNNPNVQSTVDTSGVRIRGGGSTTQKLPEGYDPVKRLRSDEIREGDFLLVPRKFAPVSTDVTEAEARLLGYYAAEGHPDETCRNLHFTFGVHERDTWGADVEQIVGSPMRVVPDASSDGLYMATRNDHGRCARVLRLHDLALRHVGSGSTTKHLSAELMRWPVKLKREFVRGALRGDGHQSWSISGEGDKFGRSFGVWYSTSSYSLAAQMQLVLAQIGFPTRIVVDRSRNAEIRGKTTTSNDCFRLVVSAPYAFDLADYVWGEQSQAHAHPHGREGWSMPRHECMLDDDFIYVPVKSVRLQANSAPVYNLTVGGDHSYLVEGLATFNSDQGNAFVIQHQPQLASFLNQISQRLDKVIPMMKLQLVRDGHLHVQAGSSFRLSSLLTAAPSGALFRNIFLAG